MNFKKYEQSYNLFNPDTATLGKYIDSNGNEQTSSVTNPTQRLNHSDYIPVSSNSIYTFSSVKNSAIQQTVAFVWYTASKVLISRTTEVKPLGITNYSLTATSPNNAEYAIINYTTANDEVMLNTGSTALPYEPYGDTWHDIPHYIHNTSTDIITTLPADVYANDTTATVGLKGNMEQSSQPSPTTPIQPQETGDLSENLYDVSNPNIFNGYYNVTTNTLLTTENNAFIYIPLVQGKKYYVYGCKRYNTSTLIRWATTSSAPLYNIPCVRTGQFAQTDIFTITAEANENYLAIFLCGDSDYSAYGTVEDAIATNGVNLVIDNGYKIPISSASTTTPVYLGEVESTRKIKKLVLTGGANEDLRKNNQDPSNYLYYLRLTVDNIGARDCLCTHLMWGTGAPTDSIGCNANLPRIIYMNFGADIMDAQTSGNTVAGLKEYLAAQYAAGTPVTVWYVLATEETAVVNEPLMKIGEYADTVSGVSIPTTTGKDTFDVLTTLKPSEVELTYTGWHDATAKEWDGSDWQ